ncbi:MAG: hypothetical protein WDO68_03130 [Gammaproteobacteria bacterium]
MPTLKLPGLDGSHLFGFLATYGLFRLLYAASLQNLNACPRLSFDEDDFCAVLDGVPSIEFLDETLRRELRTLHARLKTDFAKLDKPSDLTREFIEATARSNDDLTLDELAGMGCVVGDEAHESTLCAANGAGHQNLVLSMRDVLALMEEHSDLLHEALHRSWKLEFEPTPEERKKFDLGNRKPTLRLDPSDERLYALRLNNPTSKEAAYRTELGAQALAAAAFGGLPVVPRQRNPVTVGSERRGTRTFFYWGLWSTPASYATVRSLLVTGTRPSDDARARGVFAAFRAARASGAKGKLSFAPTEPWW